MKKYKKQISKLLESYGIELSKKEAITKEILLIIKVEVKAKKHFRKQRDNALIQIQDFNDKGN
jgi:acetolactate synthase small subunit